jgi:hypothetical protein
MVYMAVKIYEGHPESKDCLVLKKNKCINEKNLFYIITADLKSFFYVIPMKIHALITLCDKFLHA